MKRNTVVWLAVVCAFAACERGVEPTAPPPQFNQSAADRASQSGANGQPAADPDMSFVAKYVADPGFRGATVAGAVIGPEGGSLSLGEIEIIVPPGAVDRSTRFSIRLPPSAVQSLFAWAELQPHGQPFNAPVTLRLPFASTDAEEGAEILWWDEAASTWVPLPTTVTADGRLETQLSHFSYYATARLGITMAGGRSADAY